MRLGQCLLVFREGRPFSSFFVEKVDTHGTLAGIVQMADYTIIPSPIGVPFWSPKRSNFEKSQKTVYPKTVPGHEPKKNEKKRGKWNP